MDDNKLLPKLSQNLLEILDDEEYYDITIEVDIFMAEDFFLEELDTFDVIKVLFATSELYLQELITYLQSFLIENKMDWIEQNFDFIHQTKKLLVSIVQNDNLQMDEIQVWEHVIKWGTTQNPELPSDVENYSDDNFNTLKNTLRQYIPFVRFYNLTSKEFLDRLLPYDQILPKELYKDLLKTFLSLSDPNSKPINKSKPRIAKGSNLGTVYSKNRDYRKSLIETLESRQSQYYPHHSSKFSSRKNSRWDAM
ncbi:hypothetical protein C1645_872151, partial [Glomus cerebriforme]